MATVFRPPLLIPLPGSRAGRYAPDQPPNLALGRGTAARVSQEGLLAVQVGTPTGRVSQEGLLAVQVGTPTGRVSQYGVLAVLPALAPFAPPDLPGPRARPAYAPDQPPNLALGAAPAAAPFAPPDLPGPRARPAYAPDQPPNVTATVTPPAPRRRARVRFWRGPEAHMPTLADGEPAWATDTKSLWMGSASGNVRIGP